MEGTLVLSEIGGGEPVSHYHVDVALKNGLNKLPCVVGRVCVVAVYHEVALSVDLTEHSSDNVALALLILVADDSSGLCSDLCCAVGGVVIVNVDSCLRELSAEISYYLFDSFRLIIARDKDCDAVQCFS